MSRPEPQSQQLRTPRAYGAACDTCRRRRIKCDGNQPCDRCTRSAVECTYRSGSERLTTIEYVRYLEQKVGELQALLPGVPQNEAAEQVQEQIDPQLPAGQQSLFMLPGSNNEYIYRVPRNPGKVFYGQLSGLNVIRMVLNATFSHADPMRRSSPNFDVIQTLEDRSLYPPKGIPAGTYALLPPKDRVEELTAVALRTALVCHDCLDMTRFSQQLDSLYGSDPDEYDADDRNFFILVLALVALGSRYSSAHDDDEVDPADDKVKVPGVDCFRASYELLHMTEPHNLDAIRAIICHVKYFQSMLMLSKAYSHMCVGIASAMNMGLHVSRTTANAAFTPDEMYQRRKVFATLHMTNTYLSSVLGMRNLLSGVDEERKLALPIEAFPAGEQPAIAQGPITPLTETVLCQKLTNIVAKVNDSRQRVNDGPPTSPSQSYQVDLEGVAVYETEIEEWHNSLPPLREDPQDIGVMHAQLMLRLWHSLSQIILYRPFLHYITRETTGSNFNLTGYKYASACIRASMQAVWVMEVMNAKGILHEAIWLHTYLLCLAGSILTYFVTCSARSVTVRESSAGVNKAKRLLGLFAKRNLMARKCLELLDHFPPVVTV